MFTLKVTDVLLHVNSWFSHVKTNVQRTRNIKILIGVALLAFKVPMSLIT